MSRRKRKRRRPCALPTSPALESLETRRVLAASSIAAAVDTAPAADGLLPAVQKFQTAGNQVTANDMLGNRIVNNGDGSDLAGGPAGNRTSFSWGATQDGSF